MQEQELLSSQGSRERKGGGALMGSRGRTEEEEEAVQ